MSRWIFVLISLLCGSPQIFAQNNEIAVQFGKTISEGHRIRFSEIPDRVFTEESGYAGGIVYNRKLAGGDGVALLLHLPLFGFENRTPDDLFPDRDSGDPSSITAFVTPGAQVRFLQPFFLQPYVFAGVGYARVARLVPREGLDGVDFDDEGTWGVSAGGGLDVMFGRGFGIRGEVRALTTGSSDRIVPGLTFDDPSARWSATGGLVFRF